VCGQCHGIHLFGDEEAARAWRREGFAYRPGDDLAATRTLVRGRLEDNPDGVRALLRRNPEALSTHFWSDGQVRVSGREYNGLVESPCFVRGTGARRLACTSCHELHAPPGRAASGWATDQLRPDPRSSYHEAPHRQKASNSVMERHRVASGKLRRNTLP
jgi:hypothetical protein